MGQSTLFDAFEGARISAPAADGVVRLRLMVTAVTAPEPSGTYGEIVGVIGLSLDLDQPGWIQLYPIACRELGAAKPFTRYDVISVDARPPRRDPRREGWRPILASMVVEKRLRPWRPRRSWLDPWVMDSMCAINRGADGDSLALVRARTVSALKLTPHGGWSTAEQAEIDAYLSQPSLFDDRGHTPLAAPRFTGAYRYQCHDQTCRGHEQELVDGEFVALQHRLAHRPDAYVRRALQHRFLAMMCGPDRDTAFYVGRRAARGSVFSVLGVYYPHRR